jgi:hypothetical protein
MMFKDYPNGEWLDCEFIDKESGEMFFVELRKSEDETEKDFIARCQEVADDNFEKAKFVRLVGYGEAERLGYDTY